MFKHCQQPLKRLASLAGGHGALQPQPLAFFPLVTRKASTFPTSNNSSDCETTTAYRDPIRQVFISQSTDVFTNLALEDWLYRHHDFDHKVTFFNR